jgi:hypothetical protein
MITVWVTLPNTDLMRVTVYEAHPGHVLYRMIYAAMDTAVRPREMWRMMLYRGGTWLRPSYAIIHLLENEMLYLWIDRAVYTVNVDETRHESAPDAIKYRLRVIRDGMETLSKVFYAFPERHRFFLPRDVVVHEPFRVELRDPESLGHQNFMMLLLGAPLTPCAREWVYASLYDRFDWINDGINQNLEPDNPLIDADDGDWLDANEDTVVGAIEQANRMGTGGYSIFAAVLEGAVRSLVREADRTADDSDNESM